MIGKRREANWLFDVHADDYALSIHASEEILQCIKDGKIDSISVMPNMSCFDQAIELLKRFVPLEKMPKYSVHLNLMEGHCLSLPSEVPDLVDEKGYFKVTWGSLIAASLWIGQKRVSLKGQIKREIKSQIEKIKENLYPEWSVRIDSHQHTHMIPIVFDALIEAAQEEQYDLEYIRIPEEPQWPFIKNVSLWFTYSPINAVKNIVLNMFAKRNRRVIRRLGLPYNLLWGLLFSGKMDKARVERIWPDMMRYIERRDRMLEIVFHPGQVLEEEIGEEYVKKGFVEFHLSENRVIEKDAIYRGIKR